MSFHPHNRSHTYALLCNNVKTSQTLLAIAGWPLLPLICHVHISASFISVDMLNLLWLWRKKWQEKNFSAARYCCRTPQTLLEAIAQWCYLMMAALAQHYPVAMLGSCIPLPPALTSTLLLSLDLCMHPHALMLVEHLSAYLIYSCFISVAKISSLSFEWCCSFFFASRTVSGLWHRNQKVSQLPPVAWPAFSKEWGHLTNHQIFEVVGPSNPYWLSHKWPGMTR